MSQVNQCLKRLQKPFFKRFDLAVLSANSQAFIKRFA